MSDLRYAVRTLLRQPGTSLLIVVTLALGIGANTSLFSIVNGVLLRPLSFPDADRIVVVQETSRQGGDAGNAPANFLDLQQQSRTLSLLAGYRRDTFELTAAGEPAAILGTHVTPAYFDVFGVKASLGRAFASDLDRPGDPPKAVLSHSLWQERFGGTPDVIGRLAHFSGRACTVVGVLPPSFEWPVGARVWVLAADAVPPSPLAVPGELVQQREINYFDAVGRLKADVSLEQARADADAVARAIAAQHPATNEGRSFRIRTFHQFLVADVERGLFVLLGAVGLVLLIACANIASLLVARAMDRQREMAVRSALGAGRGRIVRSFLVESLLLAAAGGGLAIAVAFWTLDLLVATLPASVPRAGEIAFDFRVAAFTTVVTLLAGLLFGAAPATCLRDSTLQDGLRTGGGRTAGSRGARLLRRLLVASEVAIALVLLVAAALMGNSLWRLTTVDPGFEAGNVTAIGLALPSNRYPDLASQTALYHDVLDRLRRSPATATAAVTFPLIFQGSGSSASFNVDGESLPPSSRPRALLTSVSPGYFRAIGVPFLAGRDFTEADDDDSPGVAIINTALAKRYFGSESPIGRSLVFGSAPEDRSTIVGVVGDFRRESLDRGPEPMMFLPYRQFALPFMTLLVRSSVDREAVVAAVRDAVRDVDQQLALGEVRTLEEQRDRSAAPARFRTAVLSSFAGLALLLASLGVFGVLASSVSQRQRELGVRVALGAQPRDVYRLVLGEGARVAIAGLAAGAAVALIVTRALSSLLYEVSASDPATFLGAAALLFTVAAVAGYLPARRAARVDPVETLRAE
jgi:putative ABC transport system permease protein